MNAHELISRLRACGPQELHVVFCYLADRVHEAELLNGSKLRDAGDFKQWLDELCAASRISPEFAQGTEGQSSAESRTRLRVTGRVSEPDICHRCGHVHQGRECGEPIGGGRTCRCELEGVPA